MTALERKAEFDYRRTERLAILVDGNGPVTAEQMKLSAAEATAACNAIERTEKPDEQPMLL